KYARPDNEADGRRREGPRQAGPAAAAGPVPPGGQAELERRSASERQVVPAYPDLLVTPPNTTVSTRVPVGQLQICPNFQVFPVTIDDGP
ncbi:MAG: hypothetical protein ACYCV7_12190, partial [Acidimicrobiales bacterium]